MLVELVLHAERDRSTRPVEGGLTAFGRVGGEAEWKTSMGNADHVSLALVVELTVESTDYLNLPGTSLINTPKSSPLGQNHPLLMKAPYPQSMPSEK